MAFRCHQHTYGRSAARNVAQQQHKTVLSRRSVSLRAVKDKQAAQVVQELLQLVQGTDRGLNTPAAVQESIMQKVEQLKAVQAGAATTTDQVLSATWKVSSCTVGVKRQKHTCMQQECSMA